MHRWRFRLLVLVGLFLVGAGGVAAQGRAPWTPVPAPALQDLEYSPERLVWLDARRLVLTNGEDHQLMIFDVASNAMTPVGRNGRGPGEFAGSMLPVRYAGGLAVYDIAGTRLSRFGADLAFMKSVPVSGLFLVTTSIGDSIVVGVTGFMGAPMALRVDPETGRTDTLVNFSALDTALLAKPDLGVPNAPTFVGALGSSGHLLFISQWSYAIIGVDPQGRVLFRGGRHDLRPQPPTPAQLQARRERMQRSMPGIDSATRQRMAPMFERILQAPEPLLSIGGLGDDAGGCLYVVTRRSRGDSTEVDVFTPEAVFVRTLAVPGDVKGVSNGGALVAFYTERRGAGEEGTPDVLLYRPSAPAQMCRAPR